MFKNIDLDVEEKFEGVQFRNNRGDIESLVVRGTLDSFTLTDGTDDYGLYCKDIPKIIKALKIMHHYYTGEEIV